MTGVTISAENVGTEKGEKIRVLKFRRKNRYERNIYRKFREQLLAIAVSKKRTKNEIAKAYLSIAYYGYNLEGISAIKKICGENIYEVSLDKSIELVSRLKYPQPLNINDIWLTKHNNRNNYISKMINKNI